LNILRKLALAIAGVAITSGSGLAADLDKVLAQMDAASAKFKNAQADFATDNYTKVVDDHELQSGATYFERSGGQTEMSALLQKPAKRVIVYKDGVLNYYDPSTDQLSVFSAGKNKAQYESFLTLGFGGSGKDLKAAWQIGDLGAEKIGGADTEKLDLKNAIHVGHSTGGGEVARYIGRHGSKRVAMAVLISAVPPLMVKTEKNPLGAPISVFDGLRAAYVANRPQFYKDITLPFYGYNRPGAKISEGIREKWWLQGMMGGMKAGYDCIKAFSETDFTEDLEKFDVPTLIMHGDDDQIVPIAAAGLRSAKIVKGATLKVYPGFPHGMPATNADQINADLLAFIKRSAEIAA